MAPIAYQMNRTKLLREARITLTISDTPPRDMTFRLGLLAIRLGAWLIGFSGVDLCMEDRR